MPDRPGVEVETITEEEIGVLEETAPMGDPDLERLCECGHSLISHEMETKECMVMGCDCLGFREEVSDELSEIAKGEAEASEPDEAEAEEPQVRVGAGLAKLVGEPAEEEDTEIIPHGGYYRSEQLEIPTMTADAKVGLITSQVRQIEKLVAIMIEVLAVRRDDGTAPYDLWGKALEPAEDAQVLLQGVVKLLKTRNRNRY